MAGLAYAMRTLPTGTFCADWVGIGAALTIAYSVAFGVEPASPLKQIVLAGIVGCFVGLKTVQ
jgi:quaternary ammonium compound-resistance protein SugE